VYQKLDLATNIQVRGLEKVGKEEQGHDSPCQDKGWDGNFRYTSEFGLGQGLIRLG